MVLVTYAEAFAAKSKLDFCLVQTENKFYG